MERGMEGSAFEMSSAHDKMSHQGIRQGGPRSSPERHRHGPPWERPFIGPRVRATAGWMSECPQIPGANAISLAYLPREEIRETFPMIAEGTRTFVFQACGGPYPIVSPIFWRARGHSGPLICATRPRLVSFGETWIGQVPARISLGSPTSVQVG
jgi:hypothetical protein